MLWFLIKLAMPVVGFYALQKWWRQNLQLGMPRRPAASARSSGDVIEICPACGDMLQRGHRCASDDA